MKNEEFWIEEIDSLGRSTFPWTVATGDDGAVHIWQSKDGDDCGLHVIGGGMSIQEAFAQAFGYM